MLPPEKRAQIIAALKENPNASAVARHVGGVSDVTVWKLAKQTGIKLAGKGVALPPEKRAQIVAALKTMRNARAVTRQVGGASLSTVKKIAKQARIKLAGKGVVTTPEKRAKIIAALRTRTRNRRRQTTRRREQLDGLEDSQTDGY